MHPPGRCLGVLLLAGLAAACSESPSGPPDPATPAARRAAGEELMKQLSATIAAAQTIGFSSEEIASRTKRAAGALLAWQT